MDDEEDIGVGMDQEDGGFLSGLGVLDAGKELSDISKRYQSIMDEESAARKQAAEARRQRFEQAEQYIRSQRFGMPTTSEQLFALSAALLKPRRYRGFGATMSNVLPVLSQQQEARRTSEEERAKMLMQLQQQYATGEEEARLSGLESQRKGLGDLLKTYGSLAKGNKRSLMIDPTSGQMYDRSTGERVTPPNDIPPAATQQLISYLRNPDASRENKMLAIENFRRTFGVDPIVMMQGGM